VDGERKKFTRLWTEVAKVAIPVRPMFLRPIEAAALLSVSRSRLYELLASGTIPAIKLDGTLRVPRAGLEKLVDDALKATSAGDEQ
jgi:excisionase family DNA binding protein